MKEERLLTVLGMIDDTFVEELYRSEVERPSNLGSKRKIRVYFLIAAIILLLAACGVKAVAILEENLFPQYFSEKYRDDAEEMISENQRELLERGMVPIGQSVTCNGYTLTLESALSDGYRTLLKFLIMPPDGIASGEAYYSLKGWPQIANTNGDEIDLSAAGGGVSNHWKEADNTSAVLYEFSIVPQTGNAEKMKSGTVWNMTISELYEYVVRENGSEKRLEILEKTSGEWSFRFTFDENILLAEEQEILERPIYSLGKRILWNHKFPVIFQITSCKIRAFSATLHIEEPLLGYWDGFEYGPFQIFLKDGTVIEGNYCGGHNRGDHVEATYQFSIPVAMEDISYVQFPGGQKVSPTQGQ